MFKDLHRCHHPSLDSVGIDETRRAFVATAEVAMNPLLFPIAAHNHGYGLKITVLRGTLTHYSFFKSHDSRATPIQLWPFAFESGVESGVPVAYRTGFPSWWSMCQEALTPKDWISLSSMAVHTVTWSADAIWMIEEVPCKVPMPKVCYSPSPHIAEYEGLYESLFIHRANYYRHLIKELLSNAS